MDFTREPFVKIYTTVSPKARLWGFHGRQLMNALIVAADKAGVIDLPAELREDLPAAVASVLGCPDAAWVREHLPKIMEHKSVEEMIGEPDDDGVEPHYLVINRYHEGQYGGVSKTLSNAMSERKRKDTDRAIELGIIEPPFWWTEKEEGAA
jgi:hypothetical protein